MFVLLVAAVWYAEKLIRRHHARTIELTRNVVRAEAASQAKSDFLHNMSHELRTPLNAVIGLSEIIRTELYGPVGTKKYKEYADDIYASGTHLLGVINDVLDFAKIESGKIEVNVAATGPAEAVSGALQLLDEPVRNSGLDIVTDIAGGLPRMETDVHKLRQILVNLLSNALKFTEKGGRIHIGVRASADGRALAFTVSDTGIGMREEDLPLAIAPFGQIDGSLARKFEGTGLGLPLSKRLAELLGGSLDIVSAPGKGTAVTVTIPAAPAKAKADAESAAAPAEGIAHVAA